MGEEHQRLLRHNRPVIRNTTMNSTQFEQLKSQLKLLTPQQLKSLQGEIRHSLSDEPTTILTDEEMDAIVSLFS